MTTVSPLQTLPPLQAAPPAMELPGVLGLLPAAAREIIARSARRRRVPPGTHLERRGTRCTTVLVVTKGRLAAARVATDSADLAVSAYLVTGDVYGTHACTPGATHAFDLLTLAEEELELLEIPAPVFARAISADPSGGLLGLTSPVVRRLVSELMFDRADTRALLYLAGAFRRHALAAGATLLAEGANVEGWTFVETGAVRYGERSLGPGEDFALDAILLGTPSPVSATALVPTTTVTLPRAALEKLVAFTPTLRDVLGRRVARSNAQHDRRPQLVVTDVSAVASEVEEEEAVEIELPDDPASPPWWRPVPFYRQEEQMDCGAACLRMIARYYGYELDYRALQRMTAVGRHGSSLLDLAHAGENLGFVTNGIYGEWDTLQHVDLPVIAHLAERHHFVVIWRVTRKGVVIGDPDFATREMTREAFLKTWRGMMLLIKPTDRLAEAMSQLKPAPDAGRGLSLFGLVKPYRRVMAEVVGISLAMQAVAFAAPFCSQIIIDRVLMRGDERLLGIVFVALLGAAALTAILMYARAYLILETAVKMERDLVQTLYRRVLDALSGLFQRFTTTDILNRFIEVSYIRAFIIDNAVTITIDVVMLVCTAIVLFLYSTSLTLVALAAIPAQVVITYLLGRRIRDHMASYLNHHDAYQTHLMDSFKAFETVKAHGLERPFARSMQRLLAPTLQHGFQASLFGSTASSLTVAIDMMGAALVLWAGARKVLDGSLSLGTLIAFTMLAHQLSAPVLRTASQWRDYQRTRANMIRVGALLDIAGEGAQRSTAVLDLPAVQGNIRFRGVSFKYGSGSLAKTTLQRIDVEIGAGEIVALVGPSGCGKSTMVRLLLRLHDPTEGIISIDGNNLRDVTPESIRRQIGLVTQQVDLVTGTIFENIACGRAVSEEAVVKAAQLAGAYEFISTLPYGFQTLVGERGLPLSGGQRQRLVIARALVTDPRILIFDEATAALDPISEQLIHSRLRDIVRGRTTIIISHRLQTLRHVDRIVVMDEGRIHQVGTHESLMAERGDLYSTLALASPDWKKHPHESRDGSS